MGELGLTPIQRTFLPHEDVSRHQDEREQHDLHVPRPPQRSERQRPGFDRLHEFMERRRVTLVQFSVRSTVYLAWLYAKLGGVAQDFRR